jgi:hypothetical protein
MASFFKWYPAAEDSIVPWNARYQYPGQAIPAVKTTARINPKNGSDFGPGSVMRLEFPAQGYLNPRNTTLAFDVVLVSSGGTAPNFCRFQNNIQSLFQRVRLMYGSTPLEDIIDYNVITRGLTEWTATGGADQLSITDGIGYSVPTSLGASTTGLVSSFSNARQAIIQGVDTSTGSATVLSLGAVPNISGATSGGVTGLPIRRYTVQLNLGLLNQDKLIPIKFMASQLAIEITLATADACMISNAIGAGVARTVSYEVRNVALLPEILEFDASYDAMFLKGMKEGGVPIKFQTWHTFTFGLQGASSANIQIQERSRSVKSIYVIQRQPDNTASDSHALFYATGTTTLQQYQFRIGGRYYPAAPVQCSASTAANISNGAAEAYAELGKALRTLGDYRLSTSLTSPRWGYTTTLNTNAHSDGNLLLTGIAAGIVTTAAMNAATAQGGGFFSQAFCMSTSLETTDGNEISGLNAEEQSDIILSAQWSGTQSASSNLQAFTYFDAMLVIKENNVIELIQ